MTIGEAGDQPSVLAEFGEILDRHAEPFELTRDSRRYLEVMLSQGSGAVLSIPEGPERAEAIQQASATLDTAFAAAAAQLRTAGISTLDGAALFSVIEALCPLPPFCFGGEIGGVVPTSQTDREGSKSERERTPVGA